jgi:hypothetical protein
MKRIYGAFKIQLKAAAYIMVFKAFFLRLFKKLSELLMKYTNFN